MASDVGICNSALVKIGATTITSLTEGSKNANVCNEQYARIRDALLRSHAWNFAIARAKLAQLAMPPVFGFDHAYQLPADWLRTVSIHDDARSAGNPTYKIEGRTLLTDAQDVWMRYVRRVTDPNEMSADFREALAAAMARELALPIAQSNTLAEAMARMAHAAARKARSTDAIEDAPEPLPDGNWIVDRNV